MEFKKVYCFSNNYLWVLVSEDGSDYFYRFDKIRELKTIEKRLREREAKTIKDLKQLNINTTKNPPNGFFVAQYLKEQKWTQLNYPNYYLDPSKLRNIVNP